MAIPRRHSRPITVNGLSYRWIISVNQDSPWHKRVIITADEHPNGSQITAEYDCETIAPSMIRRIIEIALQRSWSSTSDKSLSYHLNNDEAEECFENFPRSIEVQGMEFTWKPESKSGLHLKIRMKNKPTGQLLATNYTFKREHCNELVVRELILMAFSVGWQPDESDLDCLWIEKDTCEAIVAKMNDSLKPNAP